jgi:predicted nuclease of predicted toxin-antitoxin system
LLDCAPVIADVGFQREPVTWANVRKFVDLNPPSRKEVKQVLEYRARRAKARFYADENFPARAATLLRVWGARVVTAQDAGLLGQSDRRHAAYALAEKYVLISCDRDFLNERSFPLIRCPAIFVFDFGEGSTREMIQAFRSLATVFSTPQFYDKWVKVDAQRDCWTEKTRHLDGSTSRIRYRMWNGTIQEWVTNREG